MGWVQFGKANLLFQSKNLPLKHKRKLYNQCILSNVCYGAETWTLTKSSAQKLRSMQRAHERIMVGVKKRDQIRADQIRKKTKCDDILEKVAKQKWLWAGKVSRQIDERWSKKILEWTPREGKRKKGRPKKRWCDDLYSFSQRWRQHTFDKRNWKSMMKHFVTHFINDCS